MVTQPITLSKGAYTVKIYPDTMDENFDNKLFVITPPQSPGNQDEGKKDTKIVDLLRITHTYKIKGYLTNDSSGKTAYQEKNDLAEMANGARTTGGAVSVNIDPENPDAERATISAYIEKLSISDKSMDIDSTKTYSDDIVKYIIDITLVEGISV
jgi:hypothetical protein